MHSQPPSVKNAHSLQQRSAPDSQDAPGLRQLTMLEQAVVVTGANVVSENSRTPVSSFLSIGRQGELGEK